MRVCVGECVRACVSYISADPAGNPIDKSKSLISSDRQITDQGGRDERKDRGRERERDDERTKRQSDLVF